MPVGPLAQGGFTSRMPDMRSLRWPSWLLSSLIFALAAVSPCQAQAIIEGQISSIPQPPPAPMGRYQLKAGQLAAPAKPVAVIYLEGAPSAHAGNTVSIMGQRGYQFEHHVLPIQTGTRVEFPNHDEDYHNVFSLSKTKRFDLGRYRMGENPPALTFDKPGVVRLYCEIHQHMRGVILVLDTPHFTTTTADGKFRLKGLPAGSYNLKAWLDEKTVLSAPVTLKAGQTVRLNFDSRNHK